MDVDPVKCPWLWHLQNQLFVDGIAYFNSKNHMLPTKHLPSQKIEPKFLQYIVPRALAEAVCSHSRMGWPVPIQVSCQPCWSLCFATKVVLDPYSRFVRASHTCRKGRSIMWPKSALVLSTKCQIVIPQTYQKHDNVKSKCLMYMCAFAHVKESTRLLPPDCFINLFLAL